MIGKIRYVESTALVGSVQCVDGTTVVFIDPPQDPEDGGAGVREPRTPKPTAPTTTAALVLP